MSVDTNDREALRAAGQWAELEYLDICDDSACGAQEGGGYKLPPEADHLTLLADLAREKLERLAMLEHWGGDTFAPGEYDVALKGRVLRLLERHPEWLDAMRGKEPRQERLSPWHQEIEDKLAGATPDDGSEHPAIRAVYRLWETGLGREYNAALVEVRKLIADVERWRVAYAEQLRSHTADLEEERDALVKERDEANARALRMIYNAEDEATENQRLRELQIAAERHRMMPEEREAAQWYIDHSMDMVQAEIVRAYLKRTEGP